MATAVRAPLKSLPVKTDPGFAVAVTLDRLSSVATRTERALRPSFWKKLLGGTSKDHARGVVAAAMEDAKAIRGVLNEVRQSSRQGGRGPTEVLQGSVVRLIQGLDLWHDSAVEFEESVFGAEKPLEERSRKLATLCRDLKSPASGIPAL